MLFDLHCSGKSSFHSHLIKASEYFNLPDFNADLLRTAIEKNFVSLMKQEYRSAVVMRAWRAFLSSVNFTFIVNFFRAFSLSLIYLLYQNGKLLRWSKKKLKWRRC